MKFGNQLLSLRKQKGLSQEALGNELNVSRQTISKWELGDSTPELDKLILISEFFDVTMDELIKGYTGVKDIDDRQTDIDVMNNNQNHVREKKGLYDIVVLLLKVAGIIVLIDFIIMIIYFILNGFPEA